MPKFAVSKDPRTQAQVAAAILADGRDPRTGQPLQHTEATYDPLCKCAYCKLRTLKQ